ncbi:MAG TPA: hypothetical protein PLP23_05350 [Panacibacter sp.]|nr:hypothetical protein [Panacibacter sp.]
MNITIIISTYAAVLATCSFVWNIYQYYDKKGTIKITHYLDWWQIPDTSIFNIGYIKFSILNNTDKKIYINKATLHINKVVYSLNEIDIFHFPIIIESHEEFSFQFSYLNIQDLILRKGIQNQNEIKNIRLSIMDNFTNLYSSMNIPFDEHLSLKELNKSWYKKQVF